MKDQKHENEFKIVSKKKCYAEPQLKRLGEVRKATKGIPGQSTDNSGLNPDSMES